MAEMNYIVIIIAYKMVPTSGDGTRLAEAWPDLILQ